MFDRCSHETFLCINTSFGFGVTALIESVIEWDEIVVSCLVTDGFIDAGCTHQGGAPRDGNEEKL